MAVKTKAEILAEINSLLADNTTGDISAEDVRTVLINIKDSYPNLSDSSVSDTEFGYLDGVTSAIQTQLNANAAAILLKLALSGGTITGDLTVDGDTKAKRPIITESTTARTLILTDEGSFILTTNGSSTTVTIPTSASVAFPIGTEIDLLQKGAGELTIEGGTGLTLNGVSAGSTAITAQWGGATIKKIATDEWVIVGKINDVA